MYGDTKLKLNLVGRNPDDGVTDIAYNKGYFFLRSSKNNTDAISSILLLKITFNENAFKAMDTEIY